MQHRTSYSIIGSIIIVGVILFFYFYSIVVAIPKNFPEGKIFTVQENESLRSVSLRLERESYISSALWFRILVSFSGRDRHIQVGGYTWSNRVSLQNVVNKIIRGNRDVPLTSITIPEGSTSKEISDIIVQALPNLSIHSIGEIIQKDSLDGYLFPSTYYLLPSYKESDIVAIMNKQFEIEYTNSFKDTAFPEGITTRGELVSLAAILEGEAKNSYDMKVVAGILLARIKKHMPLQVDVVKSTYKNQGLPPVPINNPGVMALNAAIHPEYTEYLYYITGRDGHMYYAKTFEEHKRNIQKYLR